MLAIEFGGHLEEASQVIVDSETRLRGIMRSAYVDLKKQLGEESTLKLPRWMVEKGRLGIIIDPGNPQVPAVVLKSDGEFEHTQWNISRWPNERDLPFAGVRYIGIALRTLQLLQR